MITSLALLAVFATTPSTALKGAEAVQQLDSFQKDQFARFQKAGTREAYDAYMQAVKQKAGDLLKDVDVASIPGEEGRDWSEVTDAANRYKDSVSLLQRYIASNPSPTDRATATVREATDYLRLEQPDEAVGLMKGLKPTSDKDAGMVASGDAQVAETLAEGPNPKSALGFLDAVTPNFAGFDAKVTNSLNMARRSASYSITRTTLVGTSAPELTVMSDKYGAFTDLSALKGKVVVLDFFAHWCPPCKASMPDMRAMTDALGDKVDVVGVTAYYGYFESKRGISKSDEFADMKGFMNQYKIDHPVVYVEKDQFGKYGVSGIPEFVLIGKDGNVKKIQLGYDKPSFAEFRKAVEDETSK